MTDEVDALVLAAGRGARLGLGPKAWLSLGGRTLLERAVAIMRDVAGRVIVGVAADELPRARALCGDADVVPGGWDEAQRRFFADGGAFDRVYGSS